MFGEIQKLLTSMSFDEARRKMQDLEKKIPEVRQAKAFIDLESELTYIGREAGDLQVEKWFQGEASFNDAPVTIMVFFETWCPHCQDEAPRLEQMFQAFRNRGVSVIGLTKVSETATEESVYGFITDYGVTFPIGKVTEAFGGRYGVESMPAGVILKNGKIVWRGKPDLIGGNTIEMILAGQ
jgi:thiol-disulfide isomerase/thioredoxin